MSLYNFCKGLKCPNIYQIHYNYNYVIKMVLNMQKNFEQMLI